MACLTVAVCLPPSAYGADPQADYGAKVRPLLSEFCGKCHGEPKPKAGVNLARFNDVASIHRDPKVWRNVLTQLNERTMPPENKPQPTDGQRAMLVDWIQHTLNNPEPGAVAKDPGRVTLRRLNRFEYNNTVRDLFDVGARPAEKFPADGAGGAGFDNNADTLFIPPILLEQYLNAADEVLKEARTEKLLVSKPEGGVSKREAAKKVIEHWAFRAFRRPVAEAELGRYLKLFDVAEARGDDFPAAIRLALKGLLVSPHFLFRVEHDRTDATEPWPVNDFELASRLSYFLWATMPDDELFDLARENKLHEPAVLEAQVRRMLKDPRSRALAEGFGTQWLGVRELLTTANPDPQKFPSFNAQVRFSMYDEAVHFVDSVFRDDAPLTTLLDANYTFVNDWLADHYGIQDRVGGGDGRGEVMRRVELKDEHRRGGILGLGAVLTVTSYPLRTSPVLRGKWVLEEVLGAPPPPPPPDLPELPKDDSPKNGMSFRKQLELHRKEVQCASCHNRMDPLGFGLENYDAVGRWRTELAGEPVDASGVMTTGETFKGPAELKKVLLARKPEFVRNLTEKMLAYALGRGLEYYDQPTVKEITEALARNDFKSSALVVEIVRSYPFRYRRNAAPADAGGKKGEAAAAEPEGSGEESETDE